MYLMIGDILANSVRGFPCAPPGVLGHLKCSLNS